MSLANQTFETRKQAEQLIADACVGEFYKAAEIDGRWHIVEITCPNTGLQCVPGCDKQECGGLHMPLNEWPKPATLPVAKDSPLEQLAQRFAIYGSDQLASARWGSSKTDIAKRRLRAEVYASVAVELREIEVQLLAQDRKLVMCSAATGLPVME